METKNKTLSELGIVSFGKVIFPKKKSYLRTTYRFDDFLVTKEHYYIEVSNNLKDICKDFDIEWNGEDE